MEITVLIGEIKCTWITLNNFKSHVSNKLSRHSELTAWEAADDKLSGIIIVSDGHYNPSLVWITQFAALQTVSVICIKPIFSC